MRFKLVNIAENVLEHELNALARNGYDVVSILEKIEPNAYSSEKLWKILLKENGKTSEVISKRR